MGSTYHIGPNGEIIKGEPEERPVDLDELPSFMVPSDSLDRRGTARHVDKAKPRPRFTRSGQSYGRRRFK